MNIYIFLICASLLSLQLFAAPIELDTPDTHIIVMRALDSWSGDKGASEDSIKGVAKRETGYTLISPNGQKYVVSSIPTLFGFNGFTESNAVFKGVLDALKVINFKLAQSAVNFKVDKAIALEPSKFTDFIKYQGELYKNLVTSEGNPATLHNSVSAKKFFSAVLSIGTVVIAGDKFGSLGSNAMLNSSIPGDVYQFSSSSRAALTPLDLSHVNFDASSYKSIDVRRVIQGNNERVGEVIIAYKNNKTDDAENAALIKAIVSLTGADTTVEAIQHARDEDFAKRQAIWDACVADGKCKNN